MGCTSADASNLGRRPEQASVSHPRPTGHMHAADFAGQCLVLASEQRRGRLAEEPVAHRKPASSSPGGQDLVGIDELTPYSQCGHCLHVSKIPVASPLFFGRSHDKRSLRGDADRHPLDTKPCPLLP